jgi:translation elongation factor P/translation initiation factor 5A
MQNNAINMSIFTYAKDIKKDTFILLDGNKYKVIDVCLSATKNKKPIITAIGANSYTKITKCFSLCDKIETCYLNIDDKIIHDNKLCE